MTMREKINIFLSPLEDKLIDRILIFTFIFCITSALMTSKILEVYPAPIPIAFKIVTYLLEVDSTACHGQNTNQNRKQKNEKTITPDTNNTTVFNNG